MKRVVAIVLPQLACEIARSKSGGRNENRAVGVILGATGAHAAADGTRPDASAALPTTAVLDAVSDDARRYGVRAGQKVTEATALLASLSVHHVSYGEIDEALGRVAEIALAFGPTAAIQLRETRPDEVRTPWGDAPFDTVWLDITGAAHLVGGEKALLAELDERVRALGHRVKLAIAEGPMLAQAQARWSAPSPSSPHGLDALPVQALPIDPETASFFLRVGVVTVGDLARLPRAKAAARLGPRAAEVLALAAGHDDAPLLPYAPPREIVEGASFDEGVETTEALLFVLRAMVSRSSARLVARGEATTRIEIEIPLDRSIVKLRAAPKALFEDPRLSFQIELPAPLAAEVDLLRALRAKLERTELVAPAVGVLLRITQIVPASKVQLDLSRDRAVSPDSLPALLAELSAEIGPERLGLLSIEDAHRPEASSRLVPMTIDRRSGSSGSSGSSIKRRRGHQLSLPLTSTKKAALPPPSRILSKPIPLGRVTMEIETSNPRAGLLTRGSVVAIGSPSSNGGTPQLFAIDDLTPLLELEDVEWWTRAPTSRAYMRAWVTSGGDLAGKAKGTKAASGTALVYIVKRTGEMFLQGWYE